MLTEEQWDNLTKVVHGERLPAAPIGFIIDSPWLPGWYGCSTLDYYTSDKIWLDANKKAVETFPDSIFLPGFWSEYGMCTEPSAFGAKPVWAKKNLPHAEKIIQSIKDVNQITVPNVKTDGLLPFAINRLKNCEKSIQDFGHQIKFAIARGPLNIASFLMGTTEFMMGLVLHPEESHKLLNTITLFTTDWLSYQKEQFPTIDGILILDDIVGFIGDSDFEEFAFPYLQRAFSAIDSTVNLFHNDAKGLVCSPYLRNMGVNMFNFSHEHSLVEIRELVGPKVVLLGNTPPRDVLANGNSGEIKTSVQHMWNSIENKNGIIWSCGGGMPQDVSTENINTFINTIQKLQGGF
jgi:uroporphyrinogen-III decarboxylase